MPRPKNVTPAAAAAATPSKKKEKTTAPTVLKKKKKTHTTEHPIKYGERLAPLLRGPKRKGFKNLRGNIRRNYNIVPHAATAIDGIMTLFADYLLDSIDHFRTNATPKRESVLVKDVLAAARPCRATEATREEMVAFAQDSIQRFNDSLQAKADQ